MSGYTKAQVEAMLEASASLQVLAEKRFWARWDNDREFRKGAVYRPEVYHITFEDGEVHVHCLMRLAMCSDYDHDTFSFPVGNLWETETDNDDEEDSA